MKYLITLLFILVIAMPTSNKSIQEELKETPAVEEYCVDIIVKYRRRIQTYEDKIQIYSERIQNNEDVNTNKRRVLLASVKLKWYINQLAVEKEYCGLDEDEQIEIDTGGENETNISRGVDATDSL